MNDELKTFGLIPGIKGYISAPVTYTMYYADGPQTYRENFAVLQIGNQYTNGASIAAEALIAEVTAALVASGTATAGIGTALAPLANAAMHWLKDMIFNPDGSVTLQFAYHYCGTAKAGLDPTFWPGGLDPKLWFNLVQHLSSAIKMIGIESILQPNVELPQHLETKANSNKES